MNELYLITFYSSLSSFDTVIINHKALLNELEIFFTVHIVDYHDLTSVSSDSYQAVLIASGGVEELVVSNFNSFPTPLLLLADGIQNSLAAALEIKSWFNNQGISARLTHGRPEVMVEELLDFYKIKKARVSVKGKRIGVIGNPSSWLVASSIDYYTVHCHWGVDFVDVPLDELYRQFDSITDLSEMEIWANDFENKAQAVLEGNHSEIIKAFKLYKALRMIIEEERLSAISVACFTLIDRMQTTGCLALSRLNDEGFPAGCEGDLPSIFTLFIASQLLDEQGFMANPTRIDRMKGELNVAHCTVGTKILDKYYIRNHYETGKGIAIQGIWPLEDVTILKCGGKNLDEYFVSAGKITENTNDPNSCRTQIKIRMEESVGYFLRNSLGNHHIVIPGNHEAVINSFMQSMSCLRVK